MRSFIENKLNEIFNDFTNELKEHKKYCELKNLRFDGGIIPSYSNPIIQKLYLLRYMPAYLVEYYIIYNKLFELEFLNDDLNILSIGAGSFIDLWGAKYARDEFSPDTNIRYTGLDVVNWDYKETLGLEECYFWNCNIKNLDKLDEDNYNVIIFAKSIGELSYVKFNNLIKAIKNTTFNCNKIVLLSSVRKSHSDMDIDRLSSIVDIFKIEHGYTSLDNSSSYWQFVNEDEPYPRLEDICDGFVYPENIKFYLTDLNSKCYGFKENGNIPCENDCKVMNRWPILTTSQIVYQIIRLER